MSALYSAAHMGYLTTLRLLYGHKRSTILSLQLAMFGRKKRKILRPAKFLSPFSPVASRIIIWFFGAPIIILVVESWFVLSGPLMLDCSVLLLLLRRRRQLRTRCQGVQIMCLFNDNVVHLPCDLSNWSKLCERQQQARLNTNHFALYLRSKIFAQSSSLQTSSLSLISSVIQHQAAKKYKFKKDKEMLHAIQIMEYIYIITSRTIPTYTATVCNTIPIQILIPHSLPRPCRFPLSSMVPSQ